MLDHVIFGICCTQRAHDRGPVHDTVTEISPAVFVRAFALGRDVLYVGGDDPVMVFIDPGQRVLAGDLHPRYINFPDQIAGPLQDQIKRLFVAADVGELKIN